MNQLCIPDIDNESNIDRVFSTASSINRTFQMMMAPSCFSNDDGIERQSYISNDDGIKNKSCTSDNNGIEHKSCIFNNDGTMLFVFIYIECTYKLLLPPLSEFTFPKEGKKKINIFIFFRNNIQPCIQSLFDSKNLNRPKNGMVSKYVGKLWKKILDEGYKKEMKRLFDNYYKKFTINYEIVEQNKHLNGKAKSKRSNRKINHKKVIQTSLEEMSFEDSLKYQNQMTAVSERFEPGSTLMPHLEYMWEMPFEETPKYQN
ncbi:5029_t:CDS:1 [Acaulospora morrowiae]|uniref:5029_t:CDS:1 n=1 Tax=Acaulospora morrowiae TaxID=94023 RepID=A0A9N9AEW2_9GLOM|nr:5029_t:CDS:1 [Acaulospora morrowiae]